MEQKESIIIQFWKTIFPEFQDKNLSLIYSHHVNEIDGNYLNKANMYLLELKPNEFNEWINAIVLPKENINGKISVDEFKENEKLNKEMEDTKNDFNKKLFLMIYKKNNLKFRIILDNGMIKCLKHLPIKEDNGLKFYDIYFINEQFKS